MDNPNNKGPAASPGRVAQQAAILESKLNKSISNQDSEFEIKFSIDRKTNSNEVILKTMQELMPRYNISPRGYLMALKDLLEKQIEADKKFSFERKIDTDESIDTSDEFEIPSRKMFGVATEQVLAIKVLGISMVPSRNGDIGKSYFNHELSAGKMQKGGIIDFREINKFPIVNSGDKLFYILHEKQGRSGLSYDGQVIPVHEAEPYPIQHGEGIERIDDIDAKGKSKGYYLRSKKTGVVLLIRDEKQRISGIDIIDEVTVKKLDYSVGNIGTQLTCPISINVEEICAGFKIRVNGKVEAGIVDGGEIITNNEVVVTKTQSGTSILALKNITAGTVIKSKLISEKGVLTINNELIDSNLSAPEINFEKTKGLVTNNRIESEQLNLRGCYFSAENKIYFGNSLFVDEKENMKLLERARAEKTAQKNSKKLVMGQLQLDLKRLTRMAAEHPDLVKHTRSLIVATNKMEFKTIYGILDEIPPLENNPIIENIRNHFQTLENIPVAVKQCEEKEVRLNQEIKEIRERMTRMSINIEGLLRSGATIKIYCGIQDDEESPEPGFIVESEENTAKNIHVKGSYSRQRGFELMQ